MVSSASCVQHCATETPIRKIALRGLDDVERVRDNGRLSVNAELGTTDDVTAIERPLVREGARAEEAVSSMGDPTACWELPLKDACEHVSELRPLGEDIFAPHFHFNCILVKNKNHRCKDPC